LVDVTDASNDLSSSASVSLDWTAIKDLTS
jgi:hypothetical protein